MIALESLRRSVVARLPVILFVCLAGSATGPAALGQSATSAAEAAAERARLAADGQRATGQRRHADAEAAYRALLDLIRRTEGEGSIETALVQQWLAGSIEAQRRFTDAETLRRTAQAIVEAHYAPLRAAGRSAEVRADAEERGLDLYGEMLGLNLMRQGRRGEADQLWARIRAQRAADGASDYWEPPEIAGMGGLPGIDGVYVSRETPQVRPATEEERQRRHDLDAQIGTALARGDVAGATAHFRDLIRLQEETVGRGHPETLSSFRDFARDLLGLEHYREAEALAREALESHRAAGSPETPTVERLLGRSLMGLGRWSDAQPLLESALAGLERSGDSDEAIDAALALAATQYHQDHLAEAALHYRRAAEGYERSYGRHHPETLTLRQFLAFVLFRDRRFAEAVAEYRVTCGGRIERARAYGRGELAGTDGASRSADAAECARRYARALRELAMSGGATESEEALRSEAFRAAQTFVQSAAGDSLARAGARIAAGGAGAGELAEQYERLVAERDSIGRRAEDAQPRTAREEQLGREIAVLADRLATRHPLYWDLRAPEPIDVVQLQARAGPDRVLLGDDEALVLFLVPPGEALGIVFAVSRDRAAWADIPLGGDELTERVRILRTQIDPRAYGLDPPEGRAARGGTAPFDRRIAHELYTALLGDAAIQSVIADRETLLFVPSGPLTSLPPGLLVTAPPEGGSAGDWDQEALRSTAWLLRSKSVALLPAVSSLRTLRQLLPASRTRATEPLLAFADPDFGGGLDALLRPPQPMRAYFRSGLPLGDALRSLPRLAGTRREGEALRRALGAGLDSVLTGDRATEAELMARNADGRLALVRVLEFATHGLIAGDAVGLVEPALALALGPTAEESMLTASEAARLTLNAEWVLLSACNTASPEATEAQGLSGLARAFFHAGARSLLVSHWRVDDSVAAWLIPRILTAQRRDSGLTRAQAVRRASLAVLDDEAAGTAHPYYWAPFTLVGEAGR